MRSLDNINDIKATFSSPVTFKNIVNSKKIQFLKDYYYQNESKIYKNTGPTVVNVAGGDNIIDDIIDLLKSEIGDFTVRFAHYFETSTPHIIHNDDHVSLPKLYKAFVIPLHYETDTHIQEDPNLIVFDQSYFLGPSKFIFNDEEAASHLPVYYNKFVTDNSNVHDKNYAGIPNELRKLIPHIKDIWLDGLSIDKAVPCKIGDIIMFDSAKLHCASDFRQLGITKKLALSIFTVQLSEELE